MSAHVRETVFELDACQEGRLQRGHEHGGRDPLAGHVADGKPDPVFARLEELVVVAADATRGHVQRVSLEPR